MPKLLFCLGCILLVISVLIINNAPLKQLDLNSVVWLSQQRQPMLNHLAIGLSSLGGMPFVLFITSLWCLYLAWYKKYTNIVFISIGISGSICTAWLLKSLVAKPRPPEMYHLVESFGSSFPSAHSAYAAALACLVMYINQQHAAYRLMVLLATLWLLLMGISRVYAGVHFPSDVLSGWSISFIWISLLSMALARGNNAKTSKQF